MNKTQFRFNSGLLLFVLSVVTLTQPSFAYIVPSNFAIKELLKTRTACKPFSYTSTISIPSGDLPGNLSGESSETAGASGKDAKTWIKLFTIETRIDPDVQTLKAEIFGNTDHATPIKAITRTLKRDTSDTIASITSLLLFSKDAETLLTTLKRFSIPVLLESDLMKLPDEPSRIGAESSSIELIGNPKSKLDAAIIYGNKADGNELWLSKDSYTPYKVRMSAKSEKGIEIQFHSATNECGHPPAITELSIGSKPVLREIIVSKSAASLGKVGFDDPASSIDPQVKQQALQLTIHWLK